MFSVNNIISKSKSHKNLQNFGKNESLFILDVLKKRALMTSETSRDIVIKSIKSETYEAEAYLPKYENLIKWYQKYVEKIIFKLTKMTMIYHILFKKQKMRLILSF
ncbi:hypothetical protein DMUE_4249 [Dictyocoela muelleri]|nr:hypothetical protein DMUE_4249 [Dictyocoela muelleri]